MLQHKLQEACASYANAYNDNKVETDLCAGYRVWLRRQQLACCVGAEPRNKHHRQVAHIAWKAQPSHSVSSVHRWGR